MQIAQMIGKTVTTSRFACSSLWVSDTREKHKITSEQNIHKGINIIISCSESTGQAELIAELIYAVSSAATFNWPGFCFYRRLFVCLPVEVGKLEK